MKNRTINIIKIFILIVSMYSVFSNITLAASLTFPSSKSMTVGKTQTLTIGSGVTGRVDITSSDPSVVSVSTSKLWIENGSASINITAKKEGKATITVTATSLASSEDGTSIKGSKSCTITVAAKQEEKTQAQIQTQKNQTTTKTENTTTTKKKENTSKKTQIVETKEKEEASSEWGIHSLKLIGIKEDGEETQLSIDPQFNIKTYEYTCNVEKNIKKIKVEKEAYEYNDLIQISGLEEELKEGESEICLKLSKEGKEELNYKIKIIKEENHEEVKEVKVEPEETKNKEPIIVSIPLLCFIILELVVILISVSATILIMRYVAKKNKNDIENKDKE